MTEPSGSVTVPCKVPASAAKAANGVSTSDKKSVLRKTEKSNTFVPPRLVKQGRSPDITRQQTLAAFPGIPPSGFVRPWPLLCAYSYGVVADLHRLLVTLLWLVVDVGISRMKFPGQFLQCVNSDRTRFLYSFVHVVNLAC